MWSLSSLTTTPFASISGTCSSLVTASPNSSVFRSPAPVGPTQRKFGGDEPGRPTGGADDSTGRTANGGRGIAPGPPSPDPGFIADRNPFRRRTDAAAVLQRLDLPLNEPMIAQYGRRLRSGWPALLEVTVGATLAWIVATRLGHPEPFFAPAA